MGADAVFAEFKARVRREVEAALEGALAACEATEVRRVAEYAALGGGHRWRAIATVAAGMTFRDDALEVCLPSACGVELAHAASLILDDLPSMDDASTRRGKPCAHLAFPRWAVDMAPPFLVSLAFQTALRNPLVSSERRIAAALEMAGAAGRMIEGQEMDVTQAAAEGSGALLECYTLKTGALYAASAKVGAILCGADETDAAVFYDSGMGLGLSYQFLDDTADQLGGGGRSGKPTGQDRRKRTALSVYGVEGARARAAAFAEQALAPLERFGPRAALFVSLVREADWARDA